uniref:Uncharacterized protein n=1 Tax=Nomascus leucogenys TaxID=61853 RepID=G1RC35_NOMLE
MASRCSEPDPEVSGVPTVRRCSSSCCPFSGRAGGPTDICFLIGTRKRISLSCEEFHHIGGRRHQSSGVSRHSVLGFPADCLCPCFTCLLKFQIVASSKEMWHSLQEDVLQLTLSSQIQAGVPDSGTAASGGTRLVSPGEPLPHILASYRQWDPMSCRSLGTDKCEALSGLCQVRGGLPPFSEPSSLVPWPPGRSLPKAVRPPLSWPPFSQQQTLPVMSGEALGWLGQAGPLAMGAAPLGEPAKEDPMLAQEA